MPKKKVREMKGRKKTLRFGTIRKGEAEAGCPRAGLQLTAGNVDLPSSHNARRGNGRGHIP